MAQESPVNRTMGAGALSVMNLGLRVCSNFAIVPLALTYLGREEYGLWIILQSVATYLAWSEIGLGQTVLNLEGAAFARGDYSGVSKILTTSFVLYWLVVMPLWVMFVLILSTQPVANWLLNNVTVEVAKAFKNYLFWFGSFIFLRVPFSVFPASLLGLREIVLWQVYDFVTIAGLFMATILGLILGGRIWTIILIANLVPLLTSVAAYIVLLSRHRHVRISKRFWAPGQLLPLLSNSLFFLLFGLGLFCQKLAGNLLAGKFIALRDVPEFFVLLLLIRVTGWFVADLVSRILQPYMIMFATQGRKDRVLFFAQLCTKCSFGIAVIYCALVWEFAEIGLRFWVGPGFFLGYGPMAFLMASFLVDVLFLSANNFMIALNRQRAVAIAMAAYGVMTLVFGVIGAKWLLPQNPVLGLCIGFLAASVVGQGVVMPWITNRWLQIGWRRYLPGFIVRPLILGICGIVSVAAIFDLMSIGFFGHVLLGILLVAVLSLIGWFVVLEREERKWVAELVARQYSLLVQYTVRRLEVES